MPVLRVACYWVTSIAGAGTVAGLAHFSTTPPRTDVFGKRSCSYTFRSRWPFGFVHIPTLVVGSVVCILLSGRLGRPLTALLGIALALALAYHVVSSLRDDDAALVLLRLRDGGHHGAVRHRPAGGPVSRGPGAAKSIERDNVSCGRPRGSGPARSHEGRS